MTREIPIVTRTLIVLCGTAGAGKSTFAQQHFESTQVVSSETWTGSFMVLEVAASTSGGYTCGTPVRVTPSGDPNDEFFPWLSVSNGGLVGITWLDRCDDPANLSNEAFAAISSDGGATFTNLLIASAASNPKNDGEGLAYPTQCRSPYTSDPAPPETRERKGGRALLSSDEHPGAD